MNLSDVIAACDTLAAMNRPYEQQVLFDTLTEGDTELRRAALIALFPYVKPNDSFERRIVREAFEAGECGFQWRRRATP